MKLDSYSRRFSWRAEELSFLDDLTLAKFKEFVEKYLTKDVFWEDRHVWVLRCMGSKTDEELVAKVTQHFEQESLKPPVMIHVNKETCQSSGIPIRYLSVYVFKDGSTLEQAIEEYSRNKS